MPFFTALEEEVSKAELAGRAVMICCDANSKMGPEYIPGDPHDISENGKIVEGIIERHALVVANGIKGKSKGVITRKRITIDGEEKSAIDLVLLSEELVENVKEVIIDEGKQFALESISKTKRGGNIKTSDHNTILTKFKFHWNKQLKKQRNIHYNLKNPEGIHKFTKMTSQDTLTSIVKKDQDVNTLTNKFLKRLNGIIHECFGKIRIKDSNNNKDIMELFNERNKLRSKDDKASWIKLTEIEELLAENCAESNYQKIKEELKDIESDEGGFNMGKLWKLRKKLCPFQKDPKTAMLDPSGNLITSDKNLEKHTLNHYKNVLRNRTMKSDLKNLQSNKEALCEERMKLATNNKSEPWTKEDLIAVLKYLKKGKSRDPNDHANEIFQYDASGQDLQDALLVLMNKIKEQLVYPQALEKCNISSIYKKGKRNDFSNYRGVFRLTVLRSILDRLIYNDIYPTIDSALTDANVGARKGRNIRDNLFVLNAITNSVTQGNEEACEIGIYDVDKCFDSLWAQDCVNDLYDTGCTDDKLVLIWLGTKNANVAVKTPHGISERVNIDNIIMQGGVLGSIQCTTSIDKLAKEVYGRPELLYKYKGVADVPPLLMVDDILTINKCDSTASAMNSTVNTFIESKKLELSHKKCCVIHVGKKTGSCPTSKVHDKIMHREESTK